MSTRTKIEPLVPLDELGLRTLDSGDREAWAHIAGVELREDYLGRAAISLADAYRVAEHRKAAEAEAHRREVQR
jgi:hypothetical protein